MAETGGGMMGLILIAAVLFGGLAMIGLVALVVLLARSKRSSGPDEYGSRQGGTLIGPPPGVSEYPGDQGPGAAPPEPPPDAE